MSVSGAVTLILYLPQASVRRSRHDARGVEQGMRQPRGFQRLQRSGQGSVWL